MVFSRSKVFNIQRFFSKTQGCVQIGHSENKILTSFSVYEIEVRPAVMAAMALAEKLLLARPARQLQAVQYLCQKVATEAFSQVWTKNYREKIAVQIPAGRASFSNDVKILFSEWPIRL